MATDTAALLAWLADRQNSGSDVVHAVYSGLRTRIQRGDFDEKEGEEVAVVQSR